MWNPSNCECECDKLCDVGEHLDYENCKCRKRLVDKLVEKCNKNIDKAKLAKTTLFKHESEFVCLHCLHCLGCNSLKSLQWDWCLFYLYMHQ